MEYIYCPNCKAEYQPVTGDYPFCPNCGADWVVEKRCDTCKASNNLYLIGTKLYCRLHKEASTPMIPNY